MSKPNIEAVRNRLRDITALLPFDPIEVSTGVVSSYVLITPPVSDPLGPTLDIASVSNNIYAWSNYQTQKLQRLIAMQSNYNEAYEYMTKNNELTDCEKRVFNDVRQKIINTGDFIDAQYNFYKQNYYFTAKK